MSTPFLIDQLKENHLYLGEEEKGCGNIYQISSEDPLIPEIHFKEDLEPISGKPALCFLVQEGGNTVCSYVLLSSLGIGQELSGDIQLTSQSECLPIQNYIHRYPASDFSDLEEERIRIITRKAFTNGVWKNVRETFNLPSKNQFIDLITLQGFRELAHELFQNPEVLLRSPIEPLTVGANFNCHHIFPGINVPRLGIPVERRTHDQLSPLVQKVSVVINGKAFKVLDRVLETDLVTRYHASQFFYVFGELLKDLKLKDGRSFVKVWYDYLNNARALFDLKDSRFADYYDISDEFKELIYLDGKQKVSPLRRVKQELKTQLSLNI